MSDGHSQIERSSCHPEPLPVILSASEGSFTLICHPNLHPVILSHLSVILSASEGSFTLKCHPNRHTVTLTATLSS